MNILDKAIGVFAPSVAVKRAVSRYQMNALSSGMSTYGGQYAKRTMSGFSPRIDDPNKDMNLTLPDIRGKSRELSATSSIAKSVIDVKTANIVGSGLHVESRIEDKILGISREEVQQKQDLIETRFNMWASGNESDMLQMDNFYTMQERVFRSMLIDGDVLSLLYIINNDKLRPNQINPLVIQNIAAHQLCNPNNTMDTETMVGGIDIDKNGSPKAYHICSPQKGLFSSVDGAMVGTWKTVSKYGSRSGRLNVIHFKNPDGRIGQYRGIPCLAPIVDLIYDLTKYQKSELTATVLSSFFTVFVKTPTGELETSPIEQFAAASASAAALTIGGVPASEKTEADDHQYQLGPGAIVGLGEGEDISTASPGRPNTAYESFVQAMLAEIGMGIGIPYEMLVKKYQSSYSASRAAFLDAWKTFTQARNWLASQWCQPIYEAWLELEVLNGNIELDGFLSDPVKRRAWASATWHGDAKGMLDPSKEVRASIDLVSNNMSTLERESRIHTGLDWDKTIERIAYEKEVMQELGVTSTPVEDDDTEEEEENDEE